MLRSRKIRLVAGLFVVAVLFVVVRAWDVARQPTDAAPATEETAAADWTPAAAREVVNSDIFDKARTLFSGLAEAVVEGGAALPGIEVLALGIVALLVVLYLITRLPGIHRLLWRAEHEVEREVRSHPGEYMSMTRDFLRVTTIVGAFAVALLVVRALMDLGKVLM
jgi:hypothetical protein